MHTIPYLELEQPDIAPARIMVVDDTAVNLSLIKTMLTDQGYEVLAFLGGAMALRAAQKNPPDLVLLDIAMPEMDGYQVCAAFKADPVLQAVPIIFLSALHDTEDKVRAFRAGGVDFISKPFQFEEVHARVTTHLKIRHLQLNLEYQNRHLQQIVDAKVEELSALHQESRKRLAEIAHMNRNSNAATFSATMAHELSQPLAAILSNAEAAELFLKMNPPQLGDVHEILIDIQRDDRRASDLIQQMRGHLKKSDVSLQLHDMNVLVADALKFLAAEAKVRSVNIFSESDGTALPVMVDRVQMQQVIINLILNSMDAMAAVGGARRDIVVCCRRTDNMQVEVSVTDSGSGFGPHVEQAFDSFFTTKPHGMGLGLSITAAIIAAHQGQIKAENAAQGGAIVRFSLPVGGGQ